MRLTCARRMTPTSRLFPSCHSPSNSFGNVAHASVSCSDGRRGWRYGWATHGWGTASPAIHIWRCRPLRQQAQRSIPMAPPLCEVRFMNRTMGPGPCFDIAAEALAMPLNRVDFVLGNSSSAKSFDHCRLTNHRRRGSRGSRRLPQWCRCPQKKAHRDLHSPFYDQSLTSIRTFEGRLYLESDP